MVFEDLGTGQRNFSSPRAVFRLVPAFDGAVHEKLILS